MPKIIRLVRILKRDQALRHGLFSSGNNIIGFIPSQQFIINLFDDIRQGSGFSDQIALLHHPLKFFNIDQHIRPQEDLVIFICRLHNKIGFIRTRKMMIEDLVGYPNRMLRIEPPHRIIINLNTAHAVN